ncbi:MAG: hypothetical protein P8177_13780, partial [Gemmatimonadota bacterium]
TPAVTVDLVALRARVDRAEAQLRELARDLAGALAATDGDAAPDLLVRASLFGVPHALPEPAAAVEDLLEQARAVERTVGRRVAELDAASIDREAAPAERQREHDLARAAVVFGPGFRVLPRLRPVDAAELGTAFAASLETQGGDPFAATSWAAGMARVRPAVDRLTTTLSYAEALGAGATRLDVAQLPLPEGQRWCALPPVDGAPPADGALSLVALNTATLDTGAPVAGLWIDEWVEIIPFAEVTTGLAFNFDEPGAQAPQTILLSRRPGDARAAYGPRPGAARTLRRAQPERRHCVDRFPPCRGRSVVTPDPVPRPRR